jgi:hypothetical protein
MTLIEAMEESAQGIGTLKVLKLDAFNLAADKLTDSEWPIILIVPWVEDQLRGKSGAWNSTTNLQGWILYKFGSSTMDYDTVELEKIVTAPAKMVGRGFFNKLNNKEVIDPNTEGVTKITFTPAYGQFDAHVHGVSFRCVVPFVENPAAC